MLINSICDKIKNLYDKFIKVINLIESIDKNVIDTFKIEYLSQFVYINKYKYNYDEFDVIKEHLLNNKVAQFTP